MKSNEARQSPGCLGSVAYICFVVILCLIAALAFSCATPNLIQQRDNQQYNKTHKADFR